MSQIIIDVPVVFNTTYPIKSNIDPRWVLKKGMFNNIHLACIDNVCEYIAKTINLKNIPAMFNNPDCYTYTVRNELVIAKHMAEESIGPPIYDMSMNNDEAILIMKKYDGNLEDLMFLYEEDQNIPMGRILDTVTALLNKMHFLNVYHGDLKERNIFYTKSYEIVLADFESSLYTTSQELKDRDIANLEVIKKWYQDIKNGTSVFENPWKPHTHKFNLIWNGKICYTL